MKSTGHIVILAVHILLPALGLSLSAKPSSELDHHVLRNNFKSDINNHSTIGSQTPENSARQVSVKKWQVGRVSRKQYEIVNMLWRKTKLFNDEEPTTPGNAAIKLPRYYLSAGAKKKLLQFTALSPILQPSTPSYIEFYYLDDNDERIKRRDAKLPSPNTEKTRSKFHTVGNMKEKRIPIISFSVNEPEFGFVAASSQKSNPPLYDKKRLRSKTFYDKDSMYNFIKNKLKTNNVIITKIKPSSKRSTNREISFDYQTCPATFESEVENVTPLLSKNYSKKNVTFPSSTKLYDKIKFFEIYDHHTQLPNDKDVFKGDSENMIKGNQIDVDGTQKLLEDAHKIIGHDDELNQKHVKKHIHSDYTEERKTEKINAKNNDLLNHPFVKFQRRVINKTSSIQNAADENTFTNNQKIFLSLPSGAARNASRPALWSNYPFAAVYVYEPSQIHCDAAALSPHWLVAAGACLSRYRHKNPMIQGRSAFVAYCGEHWQRPERVAYVKYIIVHPRYHHKDETRRYLYNIGLIQVVGSMASACIGWRPISIISHNYAANEEGSQVAAVGWGLDRYDRSYFQRNVHKVPLYVYKSLLYSSSCPGHTGYSEMKLKREEEALKNIYCLLLPPYTSEDVDPIHGSMLLVGGNLIALYLQEERRPWGVQSALYTGVWRLLPWVLEVAREPEDTDTFGIEI